MNGEAPLVDLDGFRAMMREAGIEEAVDSTLAIYLQEAPPTFARLEAAAAADDAASAASAAHALKSASSNIWATSLVHILDATERAAREEDSARVGELVEEVRSVFHAVVDRLRAEL